VIHVPIGFVMIVAAWAIASGWAKWYFSKKKRQERYAERKSYLSRQREQDWQDLDVIERKLAVGYAGDPLSFRDVAMLITEARHGRDLLEEAELANTLTYPFPELFTSAAEYRSLIGGDPL